jgi:trk system potassium uptake protein TrkH
MRLTVIVRLLGIMLAMFSITLLPPVFLSIYYNDGELLHFVSSILIMLGTGFAMWFPMRNARSDLRNREVFVIVPLFWLLLGMFAGLPLVLGPHLSFTDSVFESVSAFTTTGATVMHDLDELPKSLLFYRQQLQWFGGMGVVVLAIAILPMLGVGGMALYRAETPGPMKNEKMMPRISQGARALWVTYVGVTVACALLLWIAGMSPFDAVAHSLSTISTGGFSTHDASIAYYNSPAIEGVIMTFMMIGSINFGLHFVALRGRNLSAYWRDSEVRTFFTIVVLIISFVTLVNYLYHHHMSIEHALRISSFQVVSIITSTGFTTDNFSVWPLFLPLLLMYISFIGGCAGSTAGGIKVMRILIMLKNGMRDLRQMLHPSSVQVIRVADRVLPDRMVQSILAFFTAYILVFITFLMLLMATGVDPVTSFSAVATCLNNLGPGLGEVTSSFSTINPVAKWLLVMTMLLGRLEIFAVLLMFTPEFWRR